ncbi:putative poly(beta-D-mannuronate) O-acetylase [Cystobacter fuscus DSM 2262]|uniref:Poly(Beta-D-mannuronate) O-acetylase n=1 Tax=Cystobacter fuscus (strain ATCC 25194 / DSM 2262 / NBRC 100088 / M29) TaxID=1242864 RepID=S9PEE8_CYSF2|nr:MBOAT family O-acyltransferase [Cystobacter fuscus]EPX60717.1 putative poly(beta-D-mannuronate) O-acetylase [Cystobacter fuscus DSM 2262]
MYFHSLQFLFFLTATFALYWAVHRHKWARLGVLMGASVLFYSMWTPWPILLFAGATAINHLCIKGIRRFDSQGARRALLTLSIVSTLGVLCAFKYADLFRESARALLEPLGVAVRAEPFGLLLPVGLSFFTFQALSYVIDHYRGEIPKERTYFEHLLYLLFFPHLVAGPIVRASHLIERFDDVPSLTAEQGGQGLYRIAVGLAKKLVIADVLGSGLVDPVFATPEAYTSAECFVAAVAYSFELYFDFSAYSDIAIGTAALFGFKFEENFNRPYLATNLFEFWSRWHISLSTWLRDYLYRPLGGNRVSKPRALFNLMVVMGLGGLWHGADWRFAIWGLAHGAMECGIRVWWWVTGKPPKEGKVAMVRAGFGMLATFLVVVLTRVVFRSPTLEHAGEMYLRLMEGSMGLANVSTLVWVILAVAAVSHVTPLRLFHQAGELFVRMPVPVRAVVLVAVGLGVRHLASVETRPYVYFQF